MDSQDKIDAILEWAEDKRWFDTSFVESMEEALDKYGELTWNQERALDNIMDRFHIKG